LLSILETNKKIQFEGLLLVMKVGSLWNFIIQRNETDRATLSLTTLNNKSLQKSSY
jgi:hypothetical protein